MRFRLLVCLCFASAVGAAGAERAKAVADAGSGKVGAENAAAAVVRFNTLGGPRLSPECAAGFEKYYAGDWKAAKNLFAAALKKHPKEAAAWFGAHSVAWPAGDRKADVEGILNALRCAQKSPWAELYLRASAVSVRFSATDDRPFVKTLEAVLKAPDFSPYLKDVAREVLAKWELRRGREARAVELRRPLAYLTDWALIGPFNNRDKTGFNTVYAPEKEIDFEAAETGRNRKVRWFRPGVAPSDGRFPLAEIFDPPKHTAAYAVTYVKSEKARWAVLRVGFAGALKAFFNDREVLARPGYNDFAAEKAAVPVYLQAGWNKLLLKSAVYERPRWAFAARLTRPEGGALSGLKVSSSKEAQAAYLKDKDAYVAPLLEPENAELGLADRLEGEIRRRPNDAMVQALYGWLCDRLNLGDAEENPASKHYKKALSLAPHCPAFQLYVAARAKDANDRRRAAEKCMSEHPALPRGWLGAAWAAWAARLPLRAEEYAREALDRFGPERAPRALMILGNVLSSRNQPAAAERFYRQWVELQPFEDEAWRSLRRVQPSNAAKREVLLRALRVCGKTPLLLTMWALTLRQEGKEAVIAALRQRRYELYPASPGMALRAAAAWREAGRPAEAAALLRRALRTAPEKPQLSARLGDLLLRLGKRKEAIAAWREALRVRPNMPRLRDRLTALLRRSGGGVDRGFFAPYDVALKTLPPLDENKYREERRVTLFKQEVVRVNPNGTASRMFHLVAKLLREEGRRKLQSHYVYYEPSRQTVDILRAVVLSPNGREISHASVSDRTVSAAAGLSSRIYSENHLKHIVFRDLKPGVTIDLQYVLRDFGENIYGNYFADSFYFGDDAPTVRSQYVLDLPKSRTFRTRVFRAEVPLRRLPSKDPAREVLTWEARDLPGIVRESRMPPMQDMLPFVQVTTMSTWQEVGRWYWALAHERLKGGPELRRVTAEITRNAETPTEKLRAVHDWVIKNIRYLGIEFGRNGYQPHRPESTLKARYGDCKDTAALVTAMLREVGIEAHMVLIRAVQTGCLEPDCLPAPNLFNHAIAYVPNVEGRDYWIDGTTDYHRLGEVPFGDEGAQVLVIEKDGGRFVRIPVSTAARNRISREVSVRPDKDNGAVVFLREVAAGQFAPYFRGMAETPGQYRRRIAEAAARRFPGARLLKLHCAAPEEQGDMWTEAEFTAPQLLAGGDRKTVPASYGPANLSARYANEDKRRLPLELWFARSYTGRLVYRLGDGLKVRDTPKSIELKEPFAVYSRKVEKRDGELEISEELRLVKHRIPVKDYPKFKEFCNRVDALQAEKVILENK